ncbi:hypothetical protein RYX36_012922 [Vicia faba]
MYQNKPKKKYTYPPVSSSSNPPTIYETSRSPTGLLSKAQCSLVVDCGFSFTHASPVFQNLTLNYAVKRIDLGGKALTNNLKELISFRSVNVMDETFIIDHVKENLCFVSLDLPTHLNIATKTGNHNLFRSTYVLPDGVTHTKGFVKYPPHHHCSPSSIRLAIRETVTTFLTQLP